MSDDFPSPNPRVDPREIHLIVLTGMSGGGKTVALRALEDLEFYCVDNLPSALLPQLVGAVVEGSGSKHRRIAVGVDVRNRGADFAHMPTVLSELAAAGVQVHLIFLDCRDEVLMKRFSETRRRHPLATRGLSLADAIAEERRLLRPLMAIAEKVIDSSELNVHQLRRLVATGYAQATEGLTLMFQSFAFKRGLPLDADFVFDARCLPNPHWHAHLRPLSGKDKPVRDFLDAEPLVGEYFADTTRWLDAWLPRFEQDDRSYVTISIGCTGGRHRSVYLVEKLAAHYRARREGVLTFHRELE
ncbi:RNase adaptor protein RapZ [Rhodanobacter sp. FW510-R12]|uniref:RNase adapter RapZ n=1 Tax=unclassified Rhodanobacter TaxID=2621553 RepID=UPI0007A9EE3D|nr:MULTISPECIES: RNase adapter RapZ [unclassified Rhodanobacter]KZC16103.1 RNase adaptor protein RapZ [Rhodanobacter sp. FW104-R8]KZC26175.1 RNase adaptor protein RapZ [Rhodanobacter sp. FW510-T8]KZC30015.1 RNase adaptor protein RapZ [Rhodanobacter sp. FW510-R10]